MGRRCLALPGKGRCGRAGATLFAPMGQRRCCVARLILAGLRGKACCGAVCLSGRAGRRAGRTGAGERSWQGMDIHVLRWACRLMGENAHFPRFAVRGEDRLQPLPRPPYSPAVPRGERRALPAPAQGTSPLGIPFWGAAVIFPLPPSPKTPQAAGPCSWACRRLRPLPPRKKRKEAPMPPTRGAWARRPRAEGAGRPHCGHSRIFVTTPEPTVRPPSRIAKRRPSSHAIGVIKVISMSMLSPGITISTPSGSLMLPVTSVVRK